MDAAKRGDLDAFGALVAPHAEVLFRLAYHVTRDAAEADDAVQDGLIRAHGALGRFRDDAPLRPWLLRIVYNEARSIVRARGRRIRLLDRLRTRPGRHAPDPMLEVLALETRDEVARALARPSGRRPRGHHAPLSPGARRGRDGGDARLRPRHRQVAALSCARPIARGPRPGGHMDEMTRPRPALEARLRALAEEVPWPPTPDSLAPPRCGSSGATRTPVAHRRRLVVLALIALLRARRGRGRGTRWLDRAPVRVHRLAALAAGRGRSVAHPADARPAGDHWTRPAMCWVTACSCRTIDLATG